MKPPFHRPAQPSASIRGLPRGQTRPHKLPSLPSSPLLGRANELDFIVASLEYRATRILTILGPGGVGKTRLAIMAARKLEPLFADGLAFIPFAKPQKEESVWETIGHRLDIVPSTDTSWPDAIQESLIHRQVLLILDDCDIVSGQFKELTSILEACPDVTVLATSQVPLYLEGEQEFWLSPLPVPEFIPDDGYDAIVSSSAVELFATRARRRNAAFTINDKNAHDIAAIVRLLDGLPLGIELAAGQIRHLSPACLRRRLEQALPSLADGRRDLPERKRSIIGMVSWSIQLLPERHQELFLQLAVIEGDFSPEIAFKIMEVDQVEGWELLTSFADKSLIKRVVSSHSTSSASTRFFLLNSLRATARHLLAQQPIVHRRAIERHASAFLDMARHAAEHWHGPDYLTWFQETKQEGPNFNAIIARALTEPQLIDHALQLCDALFWPWFSQHYDAWALSRIEPLLTSAPDDLSDRTRGAAHVAAGWFAFKQSQTLRASHHFREADRLIQDRADPAALRAGIGDSYIAWVVNEDVDQGIDLLQDVVQRARINPGAWHETIGAHFGMGIAWYYAGNMAGARSSLEIALQMARSYQDVQSICDCLLLLGQIERAEGRPLDALRSIQEALPLKSEAGDMGYTLFTLDISLMIFADLGDLEFARKLAATNHHMRSLWNHQRSTQEKTDIEPTLKRIAEAFPLQGTDEEHPTLEFLVKTVESWQPDDAHSPHPTTIPELLSRRELEVLEMIAAGNTSTAIANTLFVSPHTIKRHMANIRKKLGVHSQAAAVACLQRSR